MSTIWSKLINLAGNITGTLPVANGGTGVTSSTGTVAVVLSTSPTLVTPVLGVATATSVALQSTGATPAALDFYATDDTTLASVRFIGNGSLASQSSIAAAKVTRTGRMVFLTLSSVADAATGSGTACTHLDSTVALPSWARPSGTIAAGYTTIRNNGAIVANSVGEVDITAAGTIQVYRDSTATAYTGSANAGFIGITFIYPV